MQKLISFTSVVALGLTCVISVASAAERITVVSFGGAYTNAQKKGSHEPFMKKTGVEILSEDYNGGLGKLRAQVESGKVTWDVVDLETSDVIRACDEGLIDPINVGDLEPGTDGSAAAQDFMPTALKKCGVGAIVWSTVFAYDKSKIKTAPHSIADFFNLQAYPGKRGMKRTPKVNLEMALMADGVKADDVYKVLSTPAGQDRAFKKLDQIKNQLVWWKSGAQAPQLLADGEVVMTTAYNGRIYNAVKNESKPFVIVWDGQVMDIDYWAIPTGAPNKDKAKAFLIFATAPEQLARQSKYISYGPPRKTAAAMVDVSMKNDIPTAPVNLSNALAANAEFWADYEDELNERFTAWLAN
ncbi:ABC transporter substrate-binding protein [Sedimenticola sp.]|uniref:ABC transporter substrate-binding protein n=1 Tax=Sedimenticola sp. TaxID=1940285 RepID=UPI003D0B5525